MRAAGGNWQAFAELLERSLRSSGGNSQIDESVFVLEQQGRSHAASISLFAGTRTSTRTVELAADRGWRAGLLFRLELVHDVGR